MLRFVCFVLVFLMLALVSCHKNNYANDDIYSTRRNHSSNNTGSSYNGKSSSTSAISEKGWATLDIELGRGDNKELYREIKTWLGTPYCYAKADKGVGTDCSGFVMKVYLAVYKKPIERNSARIFEKNCKEISRNDLREGDLVFFRGKGTGITHVGIYLKDGYFAHASSSRGVVVSALSQRYFETHFKCAGRVR